MNFFSHQRKAVDHSHKFVISDQDILTTNKGSAKRGAESVEENENEARIIKLILGMFDPVDDQLDRRLLYEVSGLKFDKDEFNGEDSLDSDTG